MLLGVSAGTFSRDVVQCQGLEDAMERIDGSAAILPVIGRREFQMPRPSVRMERGCEPAGEELYLFPEDSAA